MRILETLTVLIMNCESEAALLLRAIFNEFHWIYNVALQPRTLAILPTVSAFGITSPCRTQRLAVCL